jgi:hypothetical protein
MLRRKGIQFGGYLISFRNGHVQVRIDDGTYRQLKAHFTAIWLKRKIQKPFGNRQEMNDGTIQTTGSKNTNDLQYVRQGVLPHSTDCQNLPAV